MQLAAMEDVGVGGSARRQGMSRQKFGADGDRSVDRQTELSRRRGFECRFLSIRGHIDAGVGW